MKVPSILFLSFVCSIISINSFAQTKYEGYYINLQGDTIAGSIQYRQWGSNPSTITFYEGSKKIVLKPELVKTVHIYHFDSYVSYSGSRLMNPTSLRNSADLSDSTSEFSKINAFLRIIYNNKGLVLYSYEDGGRSNYYYQVNNAPVIELLFKLYQSENILREDATFRQQLLSSFSTMIFSNNLKSRLDKLQYTEKALVNFFEAMNGTNGNDRKKYPNETFVGAGVSFNSVDEKNAPLFKSPYETNISPFVIFGFTIFNQRTFGRLFFSPSLRLYTYKNTTTISSSQKATLQSGIIINPSASIGYNFVNTQAFKWNLSVGSAVLITPGAKITWNPSVGNKQVEGDNLKLALFAQTGVTISKVNIWATYTSSAFVKSYHQNFQFGAGWIINK